MPDAGPSPEWLEAANRLATVARQLVTVVHETNNLLQVISGNAEMLEMSGELSERSVTRAQAIAEHARRASSLLTEVLRFSRDPAIDAIRLDVAEAARDAIALRGYAATRARIALTLTSPGPTWAIANRRRTVQILLNLLMNAEQALAERDDGRVELTVECRQEDVIVIVADNGRGATPAVAPEFMPPVTPPGSPPPLGIGLAVAAWLAREQRGSLTLEPREGGGMIVTVKLPAAVA